MFGLGKLLMLPYSLPAAGIKYCFEKVLEVAEAEYMNEDAVKERLLLLQLQLEEGQIDEMEYRAQEAPILVQMREIREYRKRQIEAEMAERLAANTEGKRVVIETPDELS
ncbi:MAG: gas vesicle protein GvpG [Chloroflexi bacterium]|nr:gas vesicle protein GvpG [Chloroflexota bacterium]